MSFPADPLDLVVEVFLGADLTADPSTWTPTDATALALIYTRDRVAIVRGRPDQTSTADPSSCKMTVDNRLGYWSSRQPASPWFGQLRKGTPLRVTAEGHVRYTGFISALPPRWDVSGRDRYVPLVARGRLYQITRGKVPAKSALRRSTDALGPVNHWPLEDAANATSAANAVSGGVPLLAAGSPIFGAVGPAGAAAAVDFGLGGSLAANLTSVATSDVTVSVVATWTGSMTGVLATATAIPGNAGVTLYTTAGQLFADIDAVGGPATLTGPTVSDSLPHHIAVTLHDTGIAVQSRLYVDGTLIASTNAFSVLGNSPVKASLNPSGAANAAGPVVDHFALYNAVVSTSLAPAVAAYDGELAHVRFGRLSDEDNIPNTTAATVSQAMGPQGVKTFPELVRECEATDQGFLYEGVADFGLVYQSHTERENLDPALTLDYTAGHVAPPLEATDDDTGLINDVTVTRDGGSSSRLVAADPLDELSTVNVGTAPDSQTYSLHTDDQTYQIAGYRLRLGIWPGYRYPGLTMNLAAAPDLIDDWCTADLAFRAAITNPPSDIGPDDPSVIVEGYGETLGQYDWDVGANCSLEGPLRVSLVSNTSGDTDEDLGYLDFDTLTLHTGVNTTAGTWLIDAVPIDAAVADDLPRHMMCEGELITVTVVSGSSAPQTWTVTRSVNGVVKSHLANVAISLAHPFVMAL